MSNTSIKAVALVNANLDFVGKAWSKIRKAANVDASRKLVLKVNLGATNTVHVYDDHSPHHYYNKLNHKKLSKRFNLI